MIKVITVSHGHTPIVAAGTMEGDILVWDAVTGPLLVWDAVIGPLLVWVSVIGLLLVWYAVTGPFHARLSICVHIGSKPIFCPGTCTTRLCVAIGECMTKLAGHRRTVTALSFCSNDSLLASGSQVSMP